MNNIFVLLCIFFWSISGSAHFEEDEGVYLKSSDSQVYNLHTTNNLSPHRDPPDCTYMSYNTKGGQRRFLVFSQDEYDVIYGFDVELSDWRKDKSIYTKSYREENLHVSISFVFKNKHIYRISAQSFRRGWNARRLKSINCRF